MESSFEAAVANLDEYLSNASPKEDSFEWVITHLVARSLADLKCGMYLAARGYVVQMYSVMRPVRESMNLIHLFGRHQELIAEWKAGKHRKFTPKKVRDALGIEEDRIYSWMSEHSHPRFAASQVSMYPTGPATGVIVTGGLPRDHPQVLLAATMPADLLTEVAIAAGEIPMKPEAAILWPSTVRSAIQRLIPGVESLFAAIQTSVIGFDARPIAEQVLAVMQGNLASAEALEAEVARKARGSEPPGSGE
ncbi:MAG: hypothetical protein ACRDNC_06205 [Gaiellaceae bacterium]